MLRHKKIVVQPLSAQRLLEIVWEDRHAGRYPFRELRQNCPCAVCVDEWTTERILDITTIPEDIGIVGILFESFKAHAGGAVGVTSTQMSQGATKNQLLGL